MRVDRQMLNWGVFFICLGAVPFAVGEGLLNRPVAAEVLRLWPLAIVVLGIVVILSRTPARLIGGVLVAACFGLAFGSVLAASPSFDLCAGGGGGTPASRSGTFSGAATVDLQLRCGTTHVTTASGSGWTANASNGAATRIDAAGDSLSIRTENSGDLLFNGGSDWQIGLPQGNETRLSATIDAATADLALTGAKLPSVTVTVNAGTAHLDLTQSALSNLTVSVNAGTATVTLPSGSDVAGTLTVSLGSLRLCAPEDLGLQIELQQSLGSDNFASAGLARNGNTWTTPGGSTAHRATLHVTNSLGSVTLVRGSACS